LFLITFETIFIRSSGRNTIRGAHQLLEALSAPANLLGIFCQHLHAGE
jgi:hypothetical protein